MPPHLVLPDGITDYSQITANDPGTDIASAFSWRRKDAKGIIQDVQDSLKAIRDSARWIQPPDPKYVFDMLDNNVFGDSVSAFDAKQLQADLELIKNPPPPPISLRAKARKKARTVNDRG